MSTCSYVEGIGHHIFVRGHLDMVDNRLVHPRTCNGCGTTRYTTYLGKKKKL